MSSSIEYLIKLHRSGVISDDSLRKGIRALIVLEATQASPPVSPAPLAPPAPLASSASPLVEPASEKRAKRNKKKKEKRQKQKYAHLKQMRLKKSQPQNSTDCLKNKHHNIVNGVPWKLIKYTQSQIQLW